MHTIEVRDEIEPTEEVVYQAATGTSRVILDADHQAELGLRGSKTTISGDGLAGDDDQ
jgi:hypothetical protein